MLAILGDTRSCGRLIMSSLRRLRGSFLRGFEDEMSGKSTDRIMHEKPTVVAHTECSLGEGVVWDHAKECVWWVDIEGCRIHQFIPRIAEHREFAIKERPSSLALTAGEELLISTEDRIAHFSPSSGELQTVVNIKHSRCSMRLNDGACDRQGNYWVGSMVEDGGTASAALYRLNASGELHLFVDEICISNGISFNPDGSVLYFADSSTRIIRAWDYDAMKGIIENMRVFCDGTRAPGVPDGATVDRDGYLWSTRWDGWGLVRYNPEAVIDQFIELPVQRPTKCAFGGPNLSTLYITSARTGLTADELAAQPMAGSLLAVETPYKGIKETPFSSVST